ncbi:MAG: hypothetical protein JNL98_38865 [Bryobacterales bacterium]|nr:hypothetical protein [Bryobacterales bacterium]
MGISIGYSGRLDDPTRLDELIAYAKERAKGWGWECQDYCQPFSGMFFSGGYFDVGKGMRVRKGDPAPTLIEDEVRGVLLLPPRADALCLIFNREGRLANYHEVPPGRILSPAPIPGEKYFMEFGLWTTLTGEVLVHIRLATLLRELQSLFMHSLEVSDNTGYWETGDLEAMATEHMMLGAWMDALSSPDMQRLVAQHSGDPLEPDATITPLRVSQVQEMPREPKSSPGKARAAVN